MDWDYAFTIRPPATRCPDCPHVGSAMSVAQSRQRSTRQRTKERQSTLVSISGFARRGLLIRAAITSVVTILVLVLVWRLLGHGVTWAGIHPSVGSILLAAFGAACFLVGRAWRFGALLPRRQGSQRELLGATAASWGAGLLLPGPSADVAFVALARTRFAVGVARGSGSAIVARILDVVSLALIALVASFFTSWVEPAPVILAAAAALVVGLGVLLALVIPGPRSLVTRLAGRIPRLARLAARAEEELEVLNSRARWANLIGSTAFCRVATAIQYTALMGMVGVHLGFWATWFVLSIRTLLLTIPIQGIAGIGTGQAWWAGALAFEGVPLEMAVAAGLTLQAIDLAVSLPVAGIGSTLLFRRRREEPAPELPPLDVVGSPAEPVRSPIHAA